MQAGAFPARGCLMNKLLFSPRKFIPLILAWIFLLLAILACGRAGSAAEPPSVSEPLATAPLPVVNPTSVAVTAQPAIPERRFLTLEFPPKIRAGDSDIIRLTLAVDDQGNIVPTAQVEGNVVTGEVVEIPNLYETHHVIAEARLDMAGVEVRPAELISEPIEQGQTAVFYWSVRPEDVGTYRGTIWLYMKFVDKSSGEESQKTVSAQTVEIEATNFLGLSANLARSTGVVGSVLGTILGLPFFEDVIKFLLRNRLKK